MSFFSNCVEALEIPMGVKKIEYNAFIFCENLASIIIPTTVEEISQCPFLGCKGIANVTGPDKEAASGYSIRFEQGEIMTIYGVAGSCAETHANGLKIPFVSGRPNEPVPGKIQYERKADIDQTITLAFEDGSNRECSVEAVFSAENMDYIAVAPFNAEYDEVYLYRLKEINGEDLILDNILDRQEYNLAIYVYEVVTAENGYKNRDKIISFTFNKKLQQPKGGEKNGR